MPIRLMLLPIVYNTVLFYVMADVIAMYFVADVITTEADVMYLLGCVYVG